MINFYKQNKYLFIFIAVFILVFIILFIVFYGKYDLFKFPFNSNVWGNAADWVLVFGTIISLILILQTLFLQNEAHLVNKRLADIQIFRHIESIRPEISIKGETPNYSMNLGKPLSPSVETNYYLQLEKNSIKEIEVLIFYRTIFCEDIKNESFQELVPGQKIPLQNKIILDEISGENEQFNIEIIMTYKDMEGNQYLHTFNLDKKNKKTTSTNHNIQTLIQKIDW